MASGVACLSNTTADLCNSVTPLSEEDASFCELSLCQIWWEENLDSGPSLLPPQGLLFCFPYGKCCVKQVGSTELSANLNVKPKQESLWL